MSYSFNVKASSKAEAKALVTAKFDEMVAQQPIHAADRAQAEAAAGTFVDVLADDDTCDVCVHLSGSIMTHSVDGVSSIRSANVSASAYLAVREKAA